MAAELIVFTLINVTVIICILVLRMLTKRGKTVSPITELHKDKITVPACTLVQKIRLGEFTAEEVMLAYIERIQAVNELINAIVKDRFQLALEEAREVDRTLKNMTEDEKDALIQSKVLLGVPFTIKENFAAKGMPQSSGLVSRKHFVATENAEVVQRLEDAGAILVGVSNVSELCMWWESANRVYGRTKNPYDSERIVGGSSGGEAAIIAAAGSVIGIGSGQQLTHCLLLLPLSTSIFYYFIAICASLNLFFYLCYLTTIIMLLLLQHDFSCQL